MKYGLSDENLKDIIRIISSNHKITQIVLFGSRAIGNYRPSSDIDIALFGYNLNLIDILDISSELDKLNLAIKVDIIIYNWIKEILLREHINRVGISLWKK